MKKLLTLILVSAFCIALVGLSYAENAAKGTSAAQPAQAQDKAKPAGATPQMPARQIARPNFAIISGNITNIDTGNPSSQRLEVKNTADDKLHIIEVTPWTNVTKVTDLSELKTGDAVRVMTRTIDNKEVAMSVIFGKIKTVTPPKNIAQPAAAPQQAAVTPSKETK